MTERHSAGRPLALASAPFVEEGSVSPLIPGWWSSQCLCGCRSSRARFGQELLDKGGELRVVLEEEAVPGVGIDLDSGVGQMLGKQVGCLPSRP
jgi:hypothetical protein